MKITSLVENTSPDNNIESEHGLSLFIETKKHKILFDTGQTDMFLRNAKRLGIDIKNADIAILSHGHYDHGGGLKYFLEENKKAPVYISPYAFLPYYNADDKYIGLDISLKDSDRLIYTEDITDIDEGLTLYSCNKSPLPYGKFDCGLKKMHNGELISDDFLHEQYLLIKEDNKKILISGCSHKGILNITEWFSPDVLIGGFHFSKLPLDSTLLQYAKILNEKNTVFYTCHCTGTAQFEYMKTVAKNLHYLSCGQNIIL